MTAKELKDDVLAWIAENSFIAENPALRHWLEIAERLATYTDMDSAWRELAKPEYGIKRGRHIMSMAQRAVDAAGRELQRPLSKAKEAKQLRAVEVAAQELIVAIGSAPLLGGADFIDINGKDTMFAWRGTFAEDIEWPWQRIELTTLLKRAAERAAELRQKAPDRLAKSHKIDPEMVAFVRHIAVELHNATGKYMMGTLARIAATAFDRSEPITKEQVEYILRQK